VGASALSDDGTDRIHLGGPGHDRYGQKPYQPLQLIRNVRITPRVFYTGLSLIVDGDIATQIASLNCVDLNQCIWKQEYDWPIDEQSVWELYHKISAILEDDYQAWFEAQLRPPSQAMQEMGYFQLIAPLLVEVQSSFDCQSLIELPNLYSEKIPPLPTCAALHKQHPVMKHRGYYL
jgi:hypothetical protein